MVLSPPSPVVCHGGTPPGGRSNELSRNSRKQNGGALGNVIEVVKKDVKFMGDGLSRGLEVVHKDVKFIGDGLSKGLEWANKAFRIPEASKTVEDFVWLRNVEDPQAAALRFPSWMLIWFYNYLGGVWPACWFGFKAIAWCLR
ncbi:uncharacterized protein LOC121741058 [Salvia splendens]|uniref:uncharacterized protein LOC121741058 n=1 Tax=Salvia splendens TaxID=180675 RepID=UPI001C27CE72|nr:uncharacterized protein LOC121741058 [Salvia splendens]